MPVPGKINLYLPSDGMGVRTDSFIYPDYQVPTHYDSLLGKLIVWGRDREEAILRSKRALEEFIIDGVVTTIPFHQRILNEEKFLKGDISTNYINDLLKDE